MNDTPIEHHLKLPNGMYEGFRDVLHQNRYPTLRLEAL